MQDLSKVLSRITLLGLQYTGIHCVMINDSADVFIDGLLSRD